MSRLDNAFLASILDEVRPLVGQGQVASYIPALANVPANQIGVAVCTAEGQLYTAGDCATRFSIQSISKVLSLTIAMTRYPEQELWQRVGKDPSGQTFSIL